VKIRFRYNGYFSGDPNLEYKRGDTYEYGGTWDLDEVNLIDLDKLVREIGVKGNYTVWNVVAGGEVKDGLRTIKTDGDVVRFITEYKAEESVTFYLEHLDVADLDARYEDEEHSYSPFESESGTNHKFVATEGDESESDNVDGVSLNDSDYDEGFDWTDVLPDQLINPALVVTSDVQALVAFERSKNPDATRLEDFDDENGDSSDLDSICSSD